MLVRDVVDEVPVVRLDDPVRDALRAMLRQTVPGLVVVDGRGSLMAVLSVTEVLDLVLPPYVAERAPLARVIDEAHADRFLAECADQTVRGCLARRHGRGSTTVRPDATVLEVAVSMTSTGRPIAAVVDEDGTVLGAVSWSALLDRLLAA